MSILIPPAITEPKSADYARAQSWAILTAKYADAGSWAQWAASIMNTALADIENKLGADITAGHLEAVNTALGNIVLYPPPGAFIYTAPTVPTYETVPAYAPQTLGTILAIPAVVDLTIGAAPSTAITAPASLAGLATAADGLPAFTVASTLAYTAPTEPTYGATPAYVAQTLGTILALPAVADISIGAVPSTTVAFANSDFSDTLLAALRTKLESDIGTASTGLGSAEAAIFAREKARVEAVTAKAYTEATTVFSSRGFDMPPGGVVSKLSEATADKALRMADSSGKILEESTRLALDYNKHILSVSTQVLDSLSRIFDSKIMRDFEAAKTSVVLALDGFKETVSAAIAQSQLGATRITSTVASNDGTIKAFLGKIEGQVAPMKAIAETNQAKASAFGAAVQGAVANLNAQVIPEELKLKQLDSNVKIASLKVDALSKAASIQLDAAKTTVELDLQGFKETVSAEIAKGELNKTAITATVAANEGTVKVLEAQIEGQIAPIKAAIDTNVAKAGAYKSEVEGAVASLNAQVIPEELKLKGVGINAQIGESKANLAIKEAELVITEAARQLALEVTMLQNVANGAQQMVAGALNSVSTSAGFNWSAGAGTNYDGNVTEKIAGANDVARIQKGTLT